LVNQCGVGQKLFAQLLSEELKIRRESKEGKHGFRVKACKTEILKKVRGFNKSNDVQPVTANKKESR